MVEKALVPSIPVATMVTVRYELVPTDVEPAAPSAQCYIWQRRKKKRKKEQGGKEDIQLS